MQDLIIDKSFLDGASKAVVESVWTSHNPLFSEELLYEVFTTDSELRRRCFAKIPRRTDPVVLLDNLGELLRYEIEHRRPCIPLSARYDEGLHFKFNERLADATFVPNSDVLQTIEEAIARVASETQEYLVRCQIVWQFFPSFNGIEKKLLAAEIDRARIRVATDAEFVRATYASFLGHEHAPQNALEAKQLDERWIWFRCVQCQILSALRIFKKYQGNIPTPAPPGLAVRAEHSMLDAEYVTLGALCGAIATGDKEIAEDFRMVRPDGIVIDLAGNRS